MYTTHVLSLDLKYACVTLLDLWNDVYPSFSVHPLICEGGRLFCVTDHGIDTQ